jgi:drug/metabolite transporter (DMT)-like permease
MRPVSPYLPLALAVLFVSTGSILVRKAQAPPLAVAFYRIGLAALLLTPFAARSASRAWPALRGRQIVALLASGLALALHFATWIASLAHTSVAASVLLVNTAPLFSVVMARLFLAERPSRIILVAVALALVGAGLIAAEDWSGASLTGALLALAGAATMAVYHVIGRGLRAALPLQAYVLGVWATAAVTLALMAAGGGVALTGYAGETLVVLAALALVPTIGGHGLVNWSLRRLPAPTVGLFLLGEPVGASLLAYFLLHEVPGPWTIAGGAVVLVALALIVLAERR